MTRAPALNYLIDITDFDTYDIHTYGIYVVIF